MKKVSIAFIAVIIAVAGSAFATKFGDTTSPCAGYIFPDNKLSPSGTVVVADLVIPTLGDTDASGTPNEFQAIAAGQQLSTVGIQCPNQFTSICAAVYDDNDFELVDGTWRLKSTATVNCVVRYSAN